MHFIWYAPGVLVILGISYVPHLLNFFSFVVVVVQNGRGGFCCLADGPSPPFFSVYFWLGIAATKARADGMVLGVL